MTNAKRAKTDPAPSIKPPAKRKYPMDYRDGLALYLAHPEKNPEGLVVEYDDEFVVIRDKFPKASYVTIYALPCSSV
jgi:aprataxin